MTAKTRRRSSSEIGWGSEARRPRRARSLVRGAAIVVALLVLLFFAGGGWYFAGAIHEDALAVDPWEPQYGQNILEADETSVTISDPADEQPILDGPDTWGIQWRSGYGQVHGPGTAPGPSEPDPAVVSIGQGQVMRDFTLLSGRLPRPDEPIAVDRAAFPFDDPAAAVGEEVQDVVYGPDHLPAWFVPGEGTTWAVLVHGKGATRAEMLRMMRTTVAAGLPSLAIGYRNDEGVDSDPSGIYQFGRTEWKDLGAAVEYAHAQGAEDVVLVAASMGAAISAAYLEHADDPPVRALFLDSPMLDFGETVSYGAGQRSLPLIGTVPEPLTWTAKQIAALRWDVEWAAVDYLDDTSWVSVPTMVVHGDSDLTVPLRSSEQLVRAEPDLVELEEFKGAGHVASWNSDEDRYGDLLARFLADVT